MTAIALPNFLIISTMLVGMVNLITPFFTKNDSQIRNFFLFSVSGFFLINILIIDYLFINGTEIRFTLLNLSKYSISFAVEPIGLIFLTMLAFLWIPALLYTVKFLSINGLVRSNRYLFFVNSCVLVGCLIALSANLITMFIWYEILTLCTIPLIVHDVNGKSINGLIKYLKILLISSLVLFLPAIIIIYTQIGTGTFVKGGFISAYFSDKAAILLLLAFIFGISKAALYPLHSWLPAAMVASYPVSALLHAVVVVKTGLFCIFKILLYVFGLEYLQYLFGNYNWLIIFPIITILYSSLQALRYYEIKTILAYSTINQLSIALMSAFLLTPKGLAAAVMHMVSHALTKICLFYSVGGFYSMNNIYKINELMNMKKLAPKVSFVFLISSLSLIGIPPLAGFISKFYIMMAAAESDNFLVMIVLGISVLFSALYLSKMLSFIYSTEDTVKTAIQIQNNDEINDNGEAKKNTKKLHWYILLSLYLCLTGVIGFFVVQQFINVLLTFI